MRIAVALLMAGSVAGAGCRARTGARPDAGEVAPPRGRVVALVYTSNVQGEYERCGCPVHPLGGLGRRAAEVDRIRAESDGVVSVDAGDLFLPVEEAGAAARRPAASEIERRARLLAAAYARLGVTAFSPGERDLALGPTLLRRVLVEAKVPAVSANLEDLEGKPLFEADRIVDVAGVRVGIFGVTAMSPPDEAKLRSWGVVARDPVEAAGREVLALRARGARSIVALVHVGGTPDSKKLLEAVPGIDWAVLGHSGMNLEEPELVGGARMLEAMSLGRNVGRLDLHVVTGEGRGPWTSRGARAQLQATLADHRRQIADYEQRLAETTQAPNSYYQQRVAALKKAVDRETKALAALPARVTGNWFENRIVPLDESVPDQPGVAALVAAYNKQSERLAAAGKPVGISAEPKGAAAPAPAQVPSATFVGTEACARCHAPAVIAWQATKHAHALATLEKADRARSPECVPCHVTGYLQPGGPTDLAVATKRFANVGCESCHGPGSKHAELAEALAKASSPDAVSIARSAITRQVPAPVCLGCHTPDQTNNGFDYKSFVPAILGPGHGR
jgi:2',3'-cyclic-nucleotide 2'-phosphodiesterase (5'-nucleotidase family)